MKKIAVLGSNGIVGQTIINDLLNDKNEGIIAISRTIPAEKKEGVEYISLDVTNTYELSSALQGVERVFLVVGVEYKASVWAVEWPKIMRSVIQACQHNGAKLIFMDNVYAYGPVKGAFREDLELKPTSRKGKVRMELANMLDQAGNEGLEYIIAKAGEFYGPNVVNSTIYTACLENILADKKAFWLGSLGRKRTYTYVPDISKAMILLSEDHEAYKEVVWHLPTGKPHTGHEYISMIEEAVGKEVQVSAMSSLSARFLSIFISPLRELIEMFYQYENDYVFDSTKFLKNYPNFKVTSYMEGLKATIKSYTRK